MENNTYNIFDDQSAEEVVDDIRTRIDEAKQKVKSAFFSVLSFVVENPQAAVAIGGVVAAGIKITGKQLDIRRENRLRNSMIYDRSLGMYWETKKPLTANQRLTIEARHKNGESYGAILNDMRILKR